MMSGTTQGISMKILILGAGQVGTSVAAALSVEDANSP